MITVVYPDGRGGTIEVLTCRERTNISWTGRDGQQYTQKAPALEVERMPADPSPTQPTGIPAARFWASSFASQAYIIEPIGSESPSDVDQRWISRDHTRSEIITVGPKSVLNGDPHSTHKITRTAEPYDPSIGRSAGFSLRACPDMFDFDYLELVERGLVGIPANRVAADPQELRAVLGATCAAMGLSPEDIDCILDNTDTAPLPRSK